ncbi:hypothetical protein [uncultured Hymenobacter sp.]|uniref:hypothetical protein n=1 Tax=uncultured Hymenobacter sp. TaxID=170016 RepID=UPI0035CA7EE9
MIWEIQSYAGVGPIIFGMQRIAVQKLFEEKPNSFFKADQITLTDYYTQAGVFVYYDETEACNAVEFTKPANVKWQEKQLLSLPLGKLRDYMRSQDNMLEEDESGFTSYKNGVGGYTEDIDDLDESVETIICFQQGYYATALIS